MKFSNEFNQILVAKKNIWNNISYAKKKFVKQESQNHRILQNN